MPKINEIIEAIEDFAPPTLQEKWDNCGVQIGYELERECSGALLALDVTMAALREALKVGANLIITHHPMLIEGVRNFTDLTEKGRIIRESIANGIVIYSAHTSLDSCKGGLNDYLAKLLELQQIKVLEPIDGCSNEGLGRVGELNSSITPNELAKKLKRILNLSSIRYSEGGKEIRTIALCSGGGSSMLDSAKRAGVDAYLCGDLKYHNFEDMATFGISLFDIGHFESEIFAIEIFRSIISKKFTTFAPHNFYYNPVITVNK